MSYTPAFPRFVPCTLLLAVTLLTGCALQSTATPASEPTALAITGQVHGGQSPVVGAHVHVMDVKLSANANNVTDLILPAVTLAAGGGTDTQGAWVPTDANGNFSITADYGTCTSGDLIYLLATQGNPGLPTATPTPNNAALAEMAPLGVCGSTGLFSPTLSVSVNEVSTVAMGYALAGYLTGPAAVTGISSTALSHTGITNAFANAQGLITQSTGLALATTAAGATIPAQKINLLADILAACINSNGLGTPCSTLFNTATSNGIPVGTTGAGTVPTDTFTALLNIAHNPGVNVSTLTGLAAANPPYPSSINTTTLHDLTLALIYPTMGVVPSFLDFNPNLPSVDALGDLILVGDEVSNSPPRPFDNDVNDLLVLNAAGQQAFLTRLNDSSGYYLTRAQIVAVDPSGYGWMANGSLNDTGQLYRANLSTGAYTSYTPSAYTSTSQSIASDASGNILVGDVGSGRVDVFNNSGVYQTSPDAHGYAPAGVAVDTAGFAYAALGASYGIQEQVIGQTGSSGTGSESDPQGSIGLALDSSANLWATNGNSSVSKFTLTRSGSGPSAAINTTATANLTGGGLNFSTSAQPNVQIVMDGASAAWVPNYGGQSISAFSNAGVALSPATYGYATGCPSRGAAVDGSGNVWVTCDIGVTAGTSAAGTPLVEFLGLATPVATPILPGQFGARP